MPVGSAEILETLKQAGWLIRPGKGSHSVAVGPGGKGRTVVPHCRELATGTLAAIERQTGFKFRKDKRRA